MEMNLIQNLKKKCSKFHKTNFTKQFKAIFWMAHLVLHPHGIVLNFLKLDSWSPGADFIPIISTKGINKIYRGKL